MKRLSLLFTALTISLGSFAQTVENIRIESEGDNIKISYRIGGSTESQLYNVFLTCLMDGGQRFEPRAVIGDVGQNIRGGKSFNTVIWDVFEDVEEVGSVEFFIRVELVSDMSTPVATPQQEVQQRIEPEQEQETSAFGPGFESGQTKQKTKFDRRSFVAYNGSVFNPFGVSAGMIGNWGFYGSLRIGYFNEYWESYEGSYSAGVTKHIFSKEKHRLHGYAGIGMGDFFDEFEFEGGVIGVIGNRLNLTLGFSYIPYVYYGDVIFGIGIVF